MSSLVSIKWDRFLVEQQLRTEAQEIYTLYEQNLITEGEFWDWLKNFAKKKGIPLVVAASLAGAGALAGAGQTSRSWDDHNLQIQQLRAADQATLTRVEPHAYKYKYEVAPWGSGKYVFVPPDQIPDDADLGREVGERTAGEYRKALRGVPTRTLENMLSGRGGQWATGAQDLDGDGTISDLEAMTLIYDKDEEGRNKLPLKWSLTWEALKDLQDSESINEEYYHIVDAIYDGGEIVENLEFWDDILEEAEYQGRKVTLNKPMKGDVKKSKVYVRDPKTGNVKKVNFGDKKMRIKKSNPKRRKSFRARHNCDNPGPKTKARYWSCRAW